MAYYKIGKCNKAIENFDRAVTLDQGYYKAYNNSALTFWKMGLLENAIEDYRGQLR